MLYVVILLLALDVVVAGSFHRSLLFVWGILIGLCCDAVQKRSA